jgi:hypothetical protein
LAKFFKERKIYFKNKYTQHKANFAEHFVYLVKKKLYMLLRGLTSDDWPRYLPDVVNALNAKPLKQLGYLSPSEISSGLDDVKVRRARSDNKITVYSEPDWQAQNKNQDDYLTNNQEEFQPGISFITKFMSISYALKWAVLVCYCLNA